MSLPGAEGALHSISNLRCPTRFSLSCCYDSLKFVGHFSLKLTHYLLPPILDCSFQNWY